MNIAFKYQLSQGSQKHKRMNMPKNPFYSKAYAFYNNLNFHGHVVFIHYVLFISRTLELIFETSD